MQGNKFLDVLAGMIIGFLCGFFFYMAPTKCLITGPMEIEGLMLPEGVNSAIIALSAKWGGGIGIVIGLLGGLSVPITMPRGHMSKCISCTSFLICTIVAFIMHGSQLAHMAPWKIGVTFLYVFFIFIFAIPIGTMLSFIEKIRE